MLTSGACVVSAAVRVTLCTSLLGAFLLQSIIRLIQGLGAQGYPFSA